MLIVLMMVILPRLEITLRAYSTDSTRENLHSPPVFTAVHSELCDGIALAEALRMGKREGFCRMISLQSVKPCAKFHTPGFLTCQQ